MVPTPPLNDADETKAAPLPTVRRLPIYLRFLRQLHARGREVVSCTHIANELRSDPTQIRKDLAYTGIVGRPRVGYSVEQLIKAIQDFLGWNRLHDAFLVGAGHLGSALLGYERFNERHGLNIWAAFDSDPDKIGTVIHGHEIFALSRFSELVQRMHVAIGIVTVPGRAAQDVVDLMVRSGIRAIWNFAPVRPQVPEGVIIENVDLSSSLAVLSSQLTAQSEKEEPRAAMVRPEPLRRPAVPELAP